MIYRISSKKLRIVIREAINTWQRNYYTSYDDPFDVEDEYNMGLDIQRHANVDGTWSVKINCDWDASLNEPLRVFKTGEDAEAYANKKSDSIYRAYLNSENL